MALALSSKKASSRNVAVERKNLITVCRKLTFSPPQLNRLANESGDAEAADSSEQVGGRAECGGMEHRCPVRQGRVENETGDSMNMLEEEKEPARQGLVRLKGVSEVKGKEGPD
uniref:Uncharacterized protein n=1 Tax=Sphaerodactylus townsendi TaxID=933632 RepID=A0ACB8EUA3_9SAUR